MIKNLKHRGIIVFTVGCFLLITGLWFIINPYPAVKLPDEDPIAYLSIKGSHSEKEIEILEDGTVIQVLKQDGDTAGTVSFRIWEKGLLTKNDLALLTGYLQSDEVHLLQDRYEYPLPAMKGSPIAAAECCLHIQCEDSRITAVALIPDGIDSSQLHPEAPYPLNEIYLLLMNYGDSTIEIFREEIAN